MWSLAASLGLGLAIGTPQLQSADSMVWNRIQSAVATIYDARGPVGPAVLIDDRGLFLAHRGVLAQTPSSGRLGSGEMLRFRLVSTDEQTQLVLLACIDWGNRPIQPVTISPSGVMPGSGLIAALAEGQIRGEYITSDRVGIMRPSLRYVPLSELRFESTPLRMGGGLVFSQAGDLVGVLNATLEPVERLVQRVSPGLNGQAQSPSKTLTGNQGSFANQRYGPSGITVAYSLGPDVLSRVIDGFRSPGHQVQHPSIGVLFTNAVGQGALITQVSPNSPAMQAGVRQNDIILLLDDQAILNQFDLAAKLFRQNVGSKIVLGVRRGVQSLNLDVVVGSSASPVKSRSNTNVRDPGRLQQTPTLSR